MFCFFLQLFLPDPGIESRSPVLSADSPPHEPPEKLIKEVWKLILRCFSFSLNYFFDIIDWFLFFFFPPSRQFHFVLIFNARYINQSSVLPSIN